MQTDTFPMLRERRLSFRKQWGEEPETAVLLHCASSSRRRFRQLEGGLQAIRGATDTLPVVISFIDVGPVPACWQKLADQRALLCDVFSMIVQSSPSMARSLFLALNSETSTA